MIRASDLYFTRVTQLMLKDLRKNRFLVDDILCDVTGDELLKDLYGAKEVEKFNLLVDKDIQINVEHAVDHAKLPAIAIRVSGGSEDTSRTGDALSDGYRTDRVDAKSLGGIYKTPRIILGPVTPESFDYLTGKMTFPESVSLARVFDEMMVYDEVNKKAYPIVTVMNDFTLFIDPPKERPNLTGMTIRGKDESAIHVRKEYFTTEQVTFICAAKDPVEVIYLYQIMMYLIGRHRLNFFETRNFRNTTLQYSPIYKLTAPDDPNFVFARDITLNGTVEHNYIESTSRPLDGSSPDVRIADMKTPDALIAQASGQGWSGEEDP